MKYRLFAIISLEPFEPESSSATPFECFIKHTRLTFNSEQFMSIKIDQLALMGDPNTGE